MTEKNYNLLKDVLSVLTHTGNEGRMVEYLSDYCLDNKLEFYLDHKNNVYITKGVSDVYPCVVSHTDTVHRFNENQKKINIVEVQGKRPKTTFGKTFNDVTKRKMLRGADDFNNPYGIGGDDKCGVYVCLRLIEQLDICKAAFFVSEETGCWGSREADPNFFANVGYAIQFDAPGNHLVTEVCSGIRLFDRGSEFFRICNETLLASGEYLYQSHPYTDVSQLKTKFDFSCINISCGYYHMHTKDELVDVEDVEMAVATGQALVQSLGNIKYQYVFDRKAEWDLEEKRYNEWKKEFRKKYGHLMKKHSVPGVSPDLQKINEDLWKDFDDFIDNK